MKGFWTDPTLPPKMERVVEVVTSYLKHDVYHPQVLSTEDSLHKEKKAKRSKHLLETEDESDEESKKDSLSSSEEEEDLSDEESEMEPKAKKKKRALPPKAEEPKEKEVVVKVDTPAQSNIMDLVEQFKQLESKLAEN